MRQNEEYNGLGMPAPTKAHQRIIQTIRDNFVKRYPRYAANMLVTVSVIDEPERVPDLSLWRYVDKNDLFADPQEPILTIEITHNDINDKYSEESILETFKYIPTLQESFIFNYADNRWTRFSKKGIEIVIEEKDYSRVLQCFMHSLVK